MIGVTPLLYIGWKLIKGTKIYKAEEIDLLKDLDGIEEYQRAYVPSKAKYVLCIVLCISHPISQSRTGAFY